MNEAKNSPTEDVSVDKGTIAAQVDESLAEGEKEAYAVSSEEKDLYHVRLSLKNSFDPQTGKRIVKPFVQKYNVKMWKTIYDTIIAQGYNVEILHDPTK